MRYPEFLKENGIIGFVAPSCGCGTEPYRAGFDRAKEVFKSMGFNLLLGPNCYKSDGIGISTAPEDCAKELTDIYTRSDNDVIISCGGGELMCETISYVDFDKISKANPKWYMGYSDNTNFTFLLTTICDTASIYGHCVATFGMNPWHSSLNDSFNLLTGKSFTVRSYGMYERESLKDEEHPYVPYNLTENSDIRAYLNFDSDSINTADLTLSGRMIGGCMDCLVNLLGTRFDRVSEFCEKYKNDGIVWFLEACDLNVFSIRRAMWQMKEAGWFNYVKGFIFGRPANGEGFFNLDHREAVLSTARQLGVPVILDADIGHVSPMMPLISGSIGDICFSNGKLSIDMRLE